MKMNQQKRNKRILKLIVTIVATVTFFLLFLSHRLTAEQVFDRFKMVDIPIFLDEVAALQENGSLTAEAKVNPLPKSLLTLGVKSIRTQNGYFYAILDNFFVAETGFVVTTDRKVNCVKLKTPYCQKLNDYIFYYHNPG